jgi:hypothetical protein
VSSNSQYTFYSLDVVLIILFGKRSLNLLVVFFPAYIRTVMWLSSVYFVNLMRPNMKQSRKGRIKLWKILLATMYTALGISTSLTAWYALAWVLVLTYKF